MSEASYSQGILIGSVVIGLLVGAGIGYGGSQLSSDDDSGGEGVTGNLKVGFIYVGPQGDIGWTAAHDLARAELDAKYDWLETNFIENVPEGDALGFIAQLVDWGADVIFTTSFGFMDQTIEAGTLYPEVIFFHVSGFKRAPNVGTVFADFYQLYYLNGLMAGALTQTDQLGYVAAFPIPELIRHINAFHLGARAVNPDIQTHVRWILDWFNPTEATTAANDLISTENVDMLAFTEDTDAVVIAAGAATDVYSFAHYSPMPESAPAATISGQLVHWEVLYETIIQKIFLGEYTNTNLENVDILGLMKEGAVELGWVFGDAINDAFEDDLKAVMVDDPLLGTISVFDLIEIRVAQMSDTNIQYDPFTGPLYDQDGTLQLDADARMTIADLLTIDWFIGVTGGCTAAADAGCVVGSPTG